MKVTSNSDITAIIAINKEEIVYQFNKGAEILLGYSASDLIGTKKTNFFLVEEEYQRFQKDIASRYNITDSNFDAYQVLAQNNDYDSREWTVTRKDGSTFIAHSTLTPLKTNSGECIGFMRILKNVNDFKKVEKDLLLKNKVLNEAEKLTKMGHWQWNTIINKVTWSSNLFNIFEVDPNQTLNFDSYFNFVHPADKDTVQLSFDKSIADKVFHELLHRIVTTGGKTKTIQLLGEVVTDESGNVVELIGTCQDVTESKMAEQQLNKAHSELKAIFNSKSVAIITSGRDGIINNFNDGAEALLGYSAAEIVGIHNGFLFLVEEVIAAHEIEIEQLFGEKIPRSDHYEAVSKYIDLSKEEVHDTREWMHRRKDGSTFLGQVTISSIKNIDGEHIGFMAVLLDISEIKNTELELLKKNQLLTYAEQISKMANWQWNPFTDEGKSSKNLYKILELDEKITDLKLDVYLDFVHPEDKEITAQHFEKAVKNKKWESFTHRIITTSGIVKTIQLLGEVLTNEKDEIIEISGTCQDVTEIKMAEHHLQKALSELQAIFNSESILIITTDNNGIINRFNYGAEVLLGYSAAEMVGKEKPRKYLSDNEIKKFRNDIAVLNDEDLAKYDHYENLFKRELNDTREWTFFKKDGSPVRVLSTVTTIKNSNNEIEGFISISKDISEIKEAENELLKKNQLLNFAEQISMMSNWQWNTVLDKVEWSQNFYKILELDESVTDLKFNTYFSFVHPDDIEIVNQHFEKVEKDKKWESLTHRIITTSGKVKTVLILGKVFTNEKDEIIEMIGTCQDVTEIKMAEIKFRGLLESAPDAMIITNDLDKIQLVNKKAVKLFGYTSEELIGKEVDLLVPERFKPVKEKDLDNFFTKGLPKELDDGNEFYGLHKNGMEIPLQISLSPLKTEEGLLVSAAIRDITFQKKAEKKILEAKEGLEVLANKLTFQNTQLADFAHITSHNLRAPVSNLNTLIEFYKTSNTEEERTLLFDKIDIVISHLTDTLNTLIQALKTKSETSVEKETLEFSDFLNKTKEILTGQILDTEAEITGDFKKYPNINYNRVYLESIFLNLLSNSIKYKSNDRKPEISVQSVVEDGLLKLKFKDNGLGINLDRHGRKIFGLNKVFHRHPDAKGVGLFMTKVQIESMGGEITVESEVNVGTTFSINFNEER